MNSEYVAVYGGHQSVRGYKGHWKSSYILYDIGLWGVDRIITPKLEVVGVKGFKGAKLKKGDVIKLSATLDKDEKEGYSLKRIKSIEVIGKTT